jgi:hypothetical protein
VEWLSAAGIGLVVIVGDVGLDLIKLGPGSINLEKFIYIFSKIMFD